MVVGGTMMPKMKGLLLGGNGPCWPAVGGGGCCLSFFRLFC